MSSEANNLQMQTYANERIRPRAEQLRAIKAAIADDKAAIDDEYARAIGTNAWTDDRTDAPHLLQSGNGANPDDFLNYNALADLFLKFVNGTFSTVQEANGAAALWTVLQKACVRPL